MKADLGKRVQREISASMVMILIAVAALSVGFSLLADELISMPESRREAAEITALLPELRGERDRLQTVVAELKAEVESYRIKVLLAEEAIEKATNDAKLISSRLPDLQAEENRSRAERNRLVKEVIAVTSDRDSMQGKLEQLTGQLRSAEERLQDLRNRTETEQQNLDDVRSQISKEQQALVSLHGEYASLSQNLSQIKTDIASNDRLLEVKRTDLNALTVEERELRFQVERLGEDKDALENETLAAESQKERLLGEKSRVSAELEEVSTKLEEARGQLAKVRDELVQIIITRDSNFSQAEEAAARLKRLTGLEAQVRLQIRDLIEVLNGTRTFQSSAEAE